MAKGNNQKSTNDSGLHFEAQLWAAADKMRGHMDASEYKHVCLGLIFLKYISDAFEEKREQLLFGFADPKSEWFIKDEPQRAEAAENRDEYLAANVFWLPPEARWHTIKAKAKSPEIGKVIDDAMGAIERENPTLKGVLPRDYARPSLDTATRGSANRICEAHRRDFCGAKDHVRLGGLVDIINSRCSDGVSPSSERAVTDRRYRDRKDVLGRVYEYEKFASAEGTLWSAKLSCTNRRVNRDFSLSASNGERVRVRWRIPRNADSFRQDLHPDLKADFILANPPFNMSDWGGEDLWQDVRWKFGMPPVNNIGLNDFQVGRKNRRGS